MVKEIPLGHGLTATVDDEDFERVGHLRWFLVTQFMVTKSSRYAMRREVRDGKPSTVYLHRRILNAEKGQIVDHINGDGIDCRRSNLRLCTPSQNQANKKRKTRTSSPYKGVWQRPGGRWTGELTKDFQPIRIGTFDTAEEAAREYDRLARELHGEFARLNFPLEGEQRA